jgi:hypothetical protein
VFVASEWKARFSATSSRTPDNQHIAARFTMKRQRPDQPTSGRSKRRIYLAPTDFIHRDQIFIASRKWPGAVGPFLI